MSENRNESDANPQWVRVTPLSTPAVGTAATAVVVADGPTTIAAPVIEPVAETEVLPLLWIETLSDPVFEGLGERDLMAVEALRTPPPPWNLYENSVAAMIDTLSRGIPWERVQEIRASVDAEMLLAQVWDGEEEVDDDIA